MIRKKIDKKSIILVYYSDNRHRRSGPIVHYAVSILNINITNSDFFELDRSKFEITRTQVFSSTIVYNFHIHQK